LDLPNVGASISHLKKISVQNGGWEWELLKPINSSLGIIGSEMVVEYGDIWGMFTSICHQTFQPFMVECFRYIG